MSSEMISVRLDPEVVVELRDIANRLGCTVSDLLRAGATMKIHEPNTMKITWLEYPKVTLIPPDGHPERTCARCGGPNIAWSAPSPLWNYVMRGDDINGPEIFDGIVCPTCFAVIAEESGVAQLWRVYAERVDVPLKTVTPSGRIWDADAWMWREPAPVAVGGSEPAGETTGQDETPHGALSVTEWDRLTEMNAVALDAMEPMPVDSERDELKDDDEPVLPQKPRVGQKMAILPTAELDHLKDENVHLHVQLNRIRALHRQYRDVYATDETGDSCAHCNTFTDAWRVPWPCPTIQALDDPVFPAPDKETEPDYRPVLLDFRTSTRPSTRAVPTEGR